MAVWKHIKKIQSLGYTVESKQKEGYKLIKNSDLLLPWEIILGLETKVIGQRVYYFDSIDSTQNQALKMASEINNEGTISIKEIANIEKTLFSTYENKIYIFIILLYIFLIFSFKKLKNE